MFEHVTKTNWIAIFTHDKMGRFNSFQKYLLSPYYLLVSLIIILYYIISFISIAVLCNKSDYPYFVAKKH